jgi:hypothetical protein
VSGLAGATPQPLMATSAGVMESEFAVNMYYLNVYKSRNNNQH